MYVGIVAIIETSSFVHTTKQQVAIMSSSADYFRIVTPEEKEQEHEQQASEQKIKDHLKEEHEQQAYEQKIKDHLKEEHKIRLQRRRKLRDQILEEFKTKPDGFFMSGSLFTLTMKEDLTTTDDNFNFVLTNLQEQGIGMYATPAKPMKNPSKTTYNPQAIPDLIHIKRLSVAYDSSDPEKRLAQRTQRRQSIELYEQILDLKSKIARYEELFNQPYMSSEEQERERDAIKLAKIQCDAAVKQLADVMLDLDD